MLTIQILLILQNVENLLNNFLFLISTPQMFLNTFTFPKPSLMLFSFSLLFLFEKIDSVLTIRLRIRHILLNTLHTKGLLRRNPNICYFFLYCLLSGRFSEGKTLSLYSLRPPDFFCYRRCYKYIY